MRFWSRKLLALLLSGICFGLVLWLVGLLIRLPYVTDEPVVYTPEQIRAAEAARDVTFEPDPAKLPTLHLDLVVQPRHQAPVLERLVQTGEIRPLTERLPDNPVVMEGPDGIGRYGGTWLRVATSMTDVGVISWRLSASTLVRWSPLGYPIQPHVAESVTALNGNREFVVKLRKGTRWSDGHLLTADDIMYWWEYEILDNTVTPGITPPWMKTRGQRGRVEKVDDLTVKFIFPHPHGLFLEKLATPWGKQPINSPKHYLSRYHPKLADEQDIQDEMKALGLASPRSLYFYLKQFYNPEHPRLWPWICRTYPSSPPHVFVRNPYYYVVDPQGNQLPYMDQIQFDIQPDKFLTISALNGKLTMQMRHIRYENYTELLSQREASGMRLSHWYPGVRSVWLINPNNNRRVDPDRPETKWKAELLANKRFRQALSLAINRADIIKAEYNSQVRPSQVAPGAQSPFHHEGVASAYIEFDPARANRMLDELGLTRRSLDGVRRFPDDTPMVFYLDYTPFTGMGPARFVVDDWATVGVRVIARERARALFFVQKDSMDFDFQIWSSESDFMPLVSPRSFVPTDNDSFWAVGWAWWFRRGGFYGNPQALGGRGVAPPQDHPIRKSFDAYERAIQATTLQEQRRIFHEALDIAAENTWTVNIAEAPPQLVVVKDDLRNVPDIAVFGAAFQTPGNAGIELYYFEDPARHPGATAASFELMGLPRTGGAKQKDIVGRLVRYALLGIGLLLVVLLIVRHPFVGRRLLIMVPTLLVISVVVFVVIQLPPGDYLTARMIQLRESGVDGDQELVEDLKKLFHLDEPVWQQYLRWMGVKWFLTLDEPDKGLLQGKMGRSMETTQSVNTMVGDRILLTLLISMGTILFTWLVSIPIGIYSAVRQYSASDYVLTVIGFIGMCVPPFLLALVIMTVSGKTGLFSAEFAAESQWSWPKVVDLLKHIWIPVVVLGVGGTATMIRIMRANLLDELKKPYVTTARAKGVRPLKVLLKYPVRLALNPFVSGIGALFPQLVAGGAIVAMVLSLPTVGPMLLSGLFTEDMYLVGSMLMVLSLLGVLGILVSDLLLLWLDPRIRFEARSQ